ncbi:MAG: hypothetical protein FWE21_03400 [Defluviitaleaceae bacterium]|nr:hypothetical protein [Defluviitaleaceae bacterium]
MDGEAIMGLLIWVMPNIFVLTMVQINLQGVAPTSMAWMNPMDFERRFINQSYQSEQSKATGSKVA